MYFLNHLSQDIPDVEGDRVFGIRSFSVQMGKKRVFWLCVWLLQAAYIAALVVGLTSPTLLTKVAMVTHKPSQPFQNPLCDSHS
jgi:homogentisate phytyltransferase/homogentisate geranylgeranyltransferase